MAWIYSKEKSFQKILIFMGGSLGDTLVTLPALHVVRKRWPNAKIVVLSPKSAVTKSIRPIDVLKDSSLVDGFSEYPTWSAFGAIGRLCGFIWAVRKIRPHLVVYLVRSFTSGRSIKRDKLVFGLAGVTRIIGTQLECKLPPRRSFEGKHRLPKVADFHLKQLSSGGLTVPKSGRGSNSLELQEWEFDAADEWIKNNEVSYKSRLVCFGIGSNMKSKIWPLERYEELGKRLISEYQIYPVVVGGPEDRISGEILVEAWGIGRVVAGDLSIRESAALMHKMDLYVGNDTGTMHLASAVELPCVAIFSARDYKGLWEPYGQNHTILRQDVPCSGCFLTDCRVDGHPCIQQISCDQVFEACSAFFVSKVSKN